MDDADLNAVAAKCLEPLPGYGDRVKTFRLIRMPSGLRFAAAPASGKAHNLDFLAYKRRLTEQL
jgi:hypothetical protein